MRQIILDTETTGLLTTEGHRLIEIGCLEMKNRRFTGQSFHRYLNPQRPVDQGAFAIHGLSGEFLQDKPLFSMIAEELLSFISGAELIIHNAPFDVGFLNYEFKLLDKNAVTLSQRCGIIDTLVLARNKHPGQSNSLDALCRRYQIDNSKRDLHGALIDAKLLGLVYLAMTGGQDQLFGSDHLTESKQVVEGMSVSNITRGQHQRLPITQLTGEEQIAHDAFVDMLKKNGRCLWVDETH